MKNSRKVLRYSLYICLIENMQYKNTTMELIYQSVPSCKKFYSYLIHQRWFYSLLICSNSFNVSDQGQPEIISWKGPQFVSKRCVCVCVHVHRQYPCPHVHIRFPVRAAFNKAPSQLFQTYSQHDTVGAAWFMIHRVMTITLTFGAEQWLCMDLADIWKKTQVLLKQYTQWAHLWRGGFKVSNASLLGYAHYSRIRPRRRGKLQ